MRLSVRQSVSGYIFLLAFSLGLLGDAPATFMDTFGGGMLQFSAVKLGVELQNGGVTPWFQGPRTSYIPSVMFLFPSSHKRSSGLSF